MSPTDGDALSLLSMVPRTATELYLCHLGLPDDAPLKMTVSHRRARRRLGHQLERLWRDGKLYRDTLSTSQGRTLIYFRLLGPASAARNAEASREEAARRERGADRQR